MLMFGGDPEAFLFGPNGRPIPAHKLGIPVQEEAWTFPSGKIFRDGYAVEFNPNPSPSFLMLLSNFEDLLYRLKGKLPEVQVLPVPYIRIDLERDIWEGPSDVRLFGCQPVWNAYSKTPEPQLPLSISATSFPFRTSGGHIHITCDNNNMIALTMPTATKSLVKYLDITVGTRITSKLEEGRRRPFLRRNYYGSAGEYRPQTHGSWVGVEYRTPGPEIWFNHHAFLDSMTALERAVKDWTPEIVAMMPGHTPIRTRRYINCGDRNERPKLSWLGG